MKTLLAILMIVAVAMPSFALDPYAYPGDVVSHQSDAQGLSLAKINRILNEARTAELPLNVVVTSVPAAVTYTTVSGTSLAVTGSTATLRAADSTALKTVVANSGTGRAIIYEGGQVVAVLNADQIWESPKEGKLAITGTSASTVLAVTTYK